MTTRYRGPEDDGRRIPSSGPDVFRGDPNDATGACKVGGIVSLTGEKVWLRARFPKQTDKPLRPDAAMPVAEIIDMDPDPYATLPLEDV